MTALRRKASVIIDTQNFYGLTEAVLGQRAKPDPDGVVAAMAALGLDVDELFIAVAEPDPRDVEEAARRLERVAPALAHLEGELRSIEPRCGPAHADVSSAAGRIAAAGGALNGVRAKCVAVTSSDLLAELHQLASTATSDVRTAQRELRIGAAHLAALTGGSVPVGMVTAGMALTKAEQTARRLSERLSMIGSYVYAAAANLEYLNRLQKTPNLALHILSGRFPIGRDGSRAGEKQIDTLCAVECLEATRAAVASGEARTVVLVSDDDDITPALLRAAGAAVGSDVLVVVAGSLAVSNRWRWATGPCPSWFHLDACTLCRMVGLDPHVVACRRQELASLVVGNGVTFFPGPEDRVVTASGLELRYDGPVLAGGTVLCAATLDWGTDSTRPLPKVGLSTMGSTSAGRIVDAGPEVPGVNVRELQIPLNDGSRIFAGYLGAPGWWRAGHRVVVADLAGGGKWPRVMGFAPGSPIDLVEPVTAEVRQIRQPRGVQGSFATVTASAGTWEVFIAGGAVSAGDTVVIWPYEHVRRGAGRYPPKAVLLSTAI
jgi:hypothetical protein